MMHSFLLIGQSNMAGRGRKEDVEPIDKTDIFVLRNGRWWPMYVPVNPDRVTAGINLAESFAEAYKKDHPGVSVGLIPCADGGTKLEQWTPGDVLYDHAVMMSQLAQRNSEIVGILWHQGEGDCHADRWPLYRERCAHIMNCLRRDLNLPDVPILVGGLGDFLVRRSENLALYYPKVNEQLQTMAREEHKMAYVDATGLGDNGDDLHFSAPALREFGLRYYAEFQKLDDRIWEPEGEAVDYTASITEMEKL